MLAWQIPWTEEPVGPHNSPWRCKVLGTDTQTHTHTYSREVAKSWEGGLTCMCAVGNLSD